MGRDTIPMVNSWTTALSSWTHIPMGDACRMINCGWMRNWIYSSNWNWALDELEHYTLEIYTWWSEFSFFLFFHGAMPNRHLTWTFHEVSQRTVSKHSKPHLLWTRVNTIPPQLQAYYMVAKHCSTKVNMLYSTPGTVNAPVKSPITARIKAPDALSGVLTRYIQQIRYVATTKTNTDF